jgi:hypothetical protein
MWTATVVEIYVAIIGACAVTLVPVYRKIRHGDAWVSSKGGSRGGPSGAMGGRSGPGVSGSDTHHLKTFGQRSTRERINDNDSEEYLHGGLGAANWRDTNVTSGGHKGRGDDASDEMPLEVVVVKKEVDMTWKTAR